MASMNQATLIGNVGKDPEIRATQSGTKVASFSIATSETWRDRSSGEKKEETQWHNIVVWGPNSGDGDGLVGVVERFVKKGSKIAVQGAIKTRKWQDQSGQDRYTTEIVLSGPRASLILLGDSGGGGRKGPESEDDYGNTYAKARDPDAKPAGGSRSFKDEIDDEIPF